MNKEIIREYMSSLGKKGGKKAWEGVSEKKKSKIMSERRLKGIKRLAEESDYKRSKDCGSVEGAGYKGGELIKE